jgi:hypothetical protein
MHLLVKAKQRGGLIGPGAAELQLLPSIGYVYAIFLLTPYNSYLLVSL